MPTYESPIGRLHLAASPRGLTRCHVRPGPAAVEDRSRPASPAAQGVLALAARELDEYFAGTRADFSVAVDYSGLAQVDRRVLITLMAEVGYGQTASYGQLARRLAGEGLAVDPQQVGAALAANPVLVVVACHRVIGADGRLTGYAAGLRAKRRLLDLEAAQGSLALDIA